MPMVPTRKRPAALAALFLLLLPAPALADRSIDEYRTFRALSIDLVGRMPSRAEIAEFEAPAWSEDAWLDAHLTGAGYSERLRRIYNDALRLEVGGNFIFRPQSTMLRRYAIPVQMPDGTTKQTWVYFRSGQRRATTALDRGFCFNADDTGQEFKPPQPPSPATATKTVSIEALEARAVKVKPWWMYRDYASASPSQHYASWKGSEPRFVPDLVANDKMGLLTDPNGAPVTDVWVCREEAQTTASVQVTLRGTKVTVSCDTQSGAATPTCGCGVGLEGCMPATNAAVDPGALMVPGAQPLGAELPFSTRRGVQSQWWRQTWNEEAQRLFDRVFTDDRDFREVLTGRWSMANGPTAHFYRRILPGTCCGDMSALGDPSYLVPTPITLGSAMPSDLKPHEMDRWVEIADRGPKAAGFLTMPAFLAKYGTRRARAHVLYSAFLCREFTADNLQLQPSTEPNLMLRPGCSTCHAKLEPLSAYFARVKESGFQWIPSPVENPACKKDAAGKLPAGCAAYYDLDFSTTTAGSLRGAYGSAQNVEEGPAGMARWLVSQPEFAACVTKTVAGSLLGRPLDAEDAELSADLERAFVGGGYRMRALVKAILKADAYRRANNLTSEAWRMGGAR